MSENREDLDVLETVRKLLQTDAISRMRDPTTYNVTAFFFLLLLPITNTKYTAVSYLLYIPYT